jgi:hypothetical protein
MKAFPSRESIYGNDVIGVKENSGMDLRDYFASHAMQAFLSRTDTPLVINKKDISLFAYLMADAMMKAREE